ncbi:MAG TPA: hypothetical protein VF916_15935 [Ktedonobacterales bacterium]
MSTQMRQPRTRGGGGRTLMLLGVLLALAAGIIVIYVVTTAVGPSIRTVTVVVAAKDLTTSTTLTPNTTDATHTAISVAFVTKTVNQDFVPEGAYVYVSPTQLNVDLSDYVVVGQFFAGDILRTNDPRLSKVGGATGSLTIQHPAQLPVGSVLFPLKVPDLAALALVPGDHVDILVTYCIVGNTASGNVSGCPSANNESQTTFENLYVYTLESGLIYVVVTHQDALTLKLLSETGSFTLVLRKPGDSGPANTVPIDGKYIFSHFHLSPTP